MVSAPAAPAGLTARVARLEARANALPCEVAKRRRRDAAAERLRVAHDDVAGTGVAAAALKGAVAAAQRAAALYASVQEYERQVSRWVCRLACLPCLVDTFAEVEMQVALRRAPHWEAFKASFCLEAFYTLKAALRSHTVDPAPGQAPLLEPTPALVLSLIQLHLRDEENMRDMLMSMADA
eukprot:TRINITY_DN16961_c0_g1_i1.p1 TRINITY_DN16961_c0_g1~~TRINITY_DN16961_c0_g1_i1.p1  ORF type:complete len:181 (+),score=60.32 TRINITY_DN16961_c0_g1_i1:75-617(+)